MQKAAGGRGDAGFNLLFRFHRYSAGFDEVKGIAAISQVKLETVKMLEDKVDE